MKPYKWSNGEKVTAQDVLFWMNMMKVEKLNWAGYAAGTIPDDLSDVTASGNTVTFEGAEYCKPCFWMDQAFAPGTLRWLQEWNAGGLRARVLQGGTLVNPSWRLAPRLECLLH